MSYDNLINEHIATGNHWKAKERLQGRISGEFDADVFEAYGRVLLAMHDTVEAGRFLFASGKRGSEYEIAIGLYLDRYVGGDMNKLFHSFPMSFQRLAFDEFPPSVTSDLARMGFRLKEQRKAVAQRHRSPSPWEHAFSFLAIAAIAAIVLLFVGFAFSAWSGLGHFLRWMLE